MKKFILISLTIFAIVTSAVQINAGIFDRMPHMFASAKNSLRTFNPVRFMSTHNKADVEKKYRGLFTCPKPYCQVKETVLLESTKDNTIYPLNKYIALKQLSCNCWALPKLFLVRAKMGNRFNVDAPVCNFSHEKEHQIVQEKIQNISKNSPDKVRTITCEKGCIEKTSLLENESLKIVGGVPVLDGPFFRK